MTTPHLAGSMAKVLWNPSSPRSEVRVGGATVVAAVAALARYCESNFTFFFFAQMSGCLRVYVFCV